MMHGSHLRSAYLYSTIVGRKVDNAPFGKKSRSGFVLNTSCYCHPSAVGSGTASTAMAVPNFGKKVLNF